MNTHSKHDELVAKDTLQAFHQVLQGLWTLQALDDDTLGTLSGDGKMFGQFARQIEQKRNRYYCGHVDGNFNLQMVQEGSGEEKEA